MSHLLTRRQVTWLPLLVGLLGLILLIGIPSAVNAQDFRKARALHKECKQLKAAGKPCDAVKKCEAAMEARKSEPLRELTNEVRDECAAAKRAKKRRLEDEKAEDKADKQTDKVECPAGQLVTSDTDGHCCWPGQAWSNGRSACIGVPACPEGFVRAGEEACESLAAAKKRDADSDGVPDFSDVCADDAEDADGFEDDDGCPDPDNDQDGIADADDQCPLTAEDPDGTLDGDGCPEDDDIVAQGDGKGDENGEGVSVTPPETPPTPDGGPDVLGIVGWSMLGVGGATVLTAVVLDQTLLASKVDDLEAAETDDKYDDIKDELDGLRPMNQALFIAGGVLAVGGLTMGLIAALSDSGSETDVSESTDDAQAVQWRPLWNGDVLGGSLEVRW